MSHQVVVRGVYAAKFPYLDSGDNKIRPVIVASRPYGRHGIIAVIPISSRPGKELVDFDVKDWHDAGLMKPSVARVHRITTLLLTDLGSQLGELSVADSDKLRKIIRQFLEL